MGLFSADPAKSTFPVFQGAEPRELQARINAILAAADEDLQIGDMQIGGGGAGHVYEIELVTVNDDPTFAGIKAVANQCVTRIVRDGLQGTATSLTPSSTPLIGINAQLELARQELSVLGLRIIKAVIAGAGAGASFMGALLAAPASAITGEPTCCELTQTLYVDKQTTVPLAEQNGSCCAPFATIQTAIDATTAQTGGSFAAWVIHLTQGLYTEDLTFPSDRIIAFEGIGGLPPVVVVGDHTLTSGAGELSQYTSFRVWWAGSLEATGPADATLFLDFRDLTTGKTGTIPDIDASAFLGNGVIVVSELESGDIDAPTFVLGMYDARQGDDVDVDFYQEAVDTEINGNITVATAGALTDGDGFRDCTFTSASTFTGPAGSFIADGETLGTFLLTGGTLAGGATLVKSDQTLALSRTKWIDGGTPIPAARQTGAVDAPYSTIGAFLTAIGVPSSANDAGTPYEALIGQALGGYTENPAIPAYRTITLGALTTAFPSIINGNITWANIAGGGAVAPAVVSILTLRNVQLATSGNITITDDGSSLSSLIVQADDRLGALNVGGAITATGATKLNSINVSGARVVGAITSTADANGAHLLYANNATIANVTAKSIGQLTTLTTAEGARFTGTAYTVAAGQPAIFYRSRFTGVNPVVSGGVTANFDGPSWRSFREAGGTVTGPMVVLVVGGFRAGTVLGANLTDAALTISLDGGGATVGFTGGGNYYALPAATLGAGRILTLGNSGAKLDDTLCVDRRDLTANTYTIKDAAGTTLYVFAAATGGTFVARFDGTNWVRAEVGNTLT
jgi:hypothetical protein